MATVQRARSQEERPTSAERRRGILNAALQCFALRGYDATTMAEICKRAGVSTGSMYHHWGSKERLAAELYLEGVRSTQEHGLHALLAHRRTEDGIRALVRSYLDWVQAQPELARFLFAMRHAAFMESAEAELERMNTDAVETASAWFRARMQSGELPELDPSVLRAILYGPSAHFARRLLNGDADADPELAKQQLATAACAALRGLIERPSPDASSPLQAAARAIAR
jgi:AcrR family transcriptional regulator